MAEDNINFICRGETPQSESKQKMLIKMAEEHQVMKEPQQVTIKEPQQVTKEPQQVTKEPQRVTTKDPKKVEAGKRLAAHNHKRRKLKAQSEVTSGGVTHYYGIGAVIAVGVIGGLGYYIYRAERGEVQPQTQPNNPPNQPSSRPQTNKFEMD